jgi:hypothetical protein
MAAIAAEFGPSLRAAAAADIASGIDPSTVAGHNLRALLLRLLDEDDWRAPYRDACVRASVLACDRGLMYDDRDELTPLGREVAEQMRPVPWTTRPGGYGGEMLVDPDGATRAVHPGASLAMRIAALLTADDLRAAKSYRVEP